MRLDPTGRARLEAQVRAQLPANRDLEAGKYSAEDFIQLDLTDEVLNYLADAFDVLEIFDVNRRLLRIDDAITVSSFDLVAKVDDSDPGLVVPLLVSIWPQEPPDLPSTFT